MTSRTKARLAGAAMFCVLVGIVGRELETKHHAAGKQAYLAEQAARFDKFYATLHPLSHFVGTGMIVGLTFILTYELLALGIYLVIRQRSGKA